MDIEETEPKVEELNFLSSEEAKILVKDPLVKGFKSILLSYVNFLRERHPLNIKQINDELSQMKKKSINLNKYISSGSEIEDYHRLINDIDQQRSRVIELTSKAQSDYNNIHEIHNNILSIWKGIFSKLSSDKKREGEAELIAEFLFLHEIKRKELFEALKSKLHDLTSKMDAVSRKITIAQETRKLFPGYGKGYESSGVYRLEEKSKKYGSTSVKPTGDPWQDAFKK